MTFSPAPSVEGVRGRAATMVLIAVALVGLVGSVAPAASSQSEALDAVLAVVGDDSPGQGEPLRFRFSVENSSSSAKRADVSFYIAPASDPDQKLYFDRWVSTLPAGRSAKYSGVVTPAQWFPQRGVFLIGTRSYDLRARTLRFEVKRSSIVVPRFRDVTEVAGTATELDVFTCSTTGAGAAWGDVEGDGDADLFVPRRTGADHLWINDNGTFVDEAEARGVAGGTSAGVGAVIADYDNDGDQDIYVAADGPNLLYRNDGSGLFADVAAGAGVAGDEPSESASWGDFDNDGWLDLYVTNYARCSYGPTGDTITYAYDKLYRSLGDGTFEDATSLLETTGSTLGAGFQTLWFDYDDDDDLDLYLANDYWGDRPQPNFLWRNEGPSGDGWSFTNVSVDAGAALRMNAMGIGAADYDRDLDIDLAISNIYAAVLLQNKGDGTFQNRAERARVARPLQRATSRSVTWGVEFADFNNDGWEDLFFAAGSLGFEGPQPDAIFTNARNGRFLDHSAPSRASDPQIGRGVAVADYDRDGRMDLFVLNQAGTPRLFRNVTRRGSTHWLQVELVGTASNRDACGAKVVAHVGSARLLRQVFCGGTSLSSGNERILHYGLGNHDRVGIIEVMWPSGRVQTLEDVRVDRRMEIVEPGGAE